MSSKMKKILTVVILILMSILTINTKVKAKSIGYDATQVTAAAYEAENWHTADVVDGAPGNNTFCVYVKEDLIAHSTYDVINYIYIDGETSYIYENNKNTHANRADHGLLATHTSSANVSMAWILNQDDPGGHPYQNIYSDKQLAVYGYFDTWLNANGLVFTHRNADSSGHVYTNQSWIQQANNYAANYSNSGKASITNNTKQENIKVESYEQDGNNYIKVGPLNFTYSQTITGMAVYDQDNNQISAEYGRYEGTNLRISSNPADVIASGQDFYVLVREDGNTSRITKIDASVQAVREKLMAEIWTLSRYNGIGNQNLITTNAWKTTETDDITVNILPEPVDLIGDLYVLKVNEDALKEEDREIRLPGVGFIIQRKNNGMYVIQDENGNISYTEDRGEATEFYTDENGEIHIENLIVGEYIAYETKNPNYGYEFPEDGQPIRVEVDKDLPDILTNKQKYIKLSGYVWEDRITSKESIKNSLYRDPDTVDPVTGDPIDTNDIRVPGITVNLIERGENGGRDTVVKTTVTGDNGEYQFVDVEVDKVRTDKYYVEFIYNGIKYTNVVPSFRDNQEQYNAYLELNNSSKAEESDATREEFNSNFATIEGGDNNSQGSIRYEYGDVNYDGEITREDAQLVLEHSVKARELNDFEKIPADVNKDGQINASDAQAILIAAENGTSLGETGIISNTGKAIGTDGSERELLYANDMSGVSNETVYKSMFVNGDQYTINALTDNTGYKIASDFEWGIEEIKWINLGLNRRDEPDLGIAKDLQNVRLSINGYNHVYEYGNRFKNQSAYVDDEHKYGIYDSDVKFNVGVQFENEYGSMQYTRPIYKSDYDFVSEDKSKELNVVLNYRISVANKATNLTSRVNTIVDYYDARYSGIESIVPITVNENGEEVEGTPLTEGTDYTVEGYNDQYGKLTINTNAEIEAQTEAMFEVRFILSREAVATILNSETTEDDLLHNVVEITSYSTLENGKPYAGIDTNSNPGNAIPNQEDTSTYQDDTDTAPTLRLTVANARKLTGMVFEDNPVFAERQNAGDINSGAERKGNGYYDDGENKVKDVKVTLTENTGSGQVYEATTGEDGSFEINNYIPGNYDLTYTWGDNTYKVQNYKATVYVDQARYNDSQENNRWYEAGNATDATRYSDAIDDYATRERIDAEIAEKDKNASTSGNTYTENTMVSTAPEMGIPIEYGTETSSGGDELTYEIRNLDFGIIQRPIQEIELNKRVSKFKVTLANGQVIVDAQIDEDGNMTGQTAGLVHMPAGQGIPENGFVRLELDNELIQGARLEITYTIKASNISELDYNDENYYNFGIIPQGQTATDTIRTITPVAVIDYLDKEWGFDPSINDGWEVKTVDELQSLVAVEVYNAPESTIDDKIILYTEKLKDQTLAPIGNNANIPSENSVELNCSKLLSNSDEISFDNEVEITEIDKPNGGPETPSTPGNYVPGTSDPGEPDDSTSETVIVTPNTGDNMNFIVPIVTGIVALVILGVGIILIKRKV